MAERIDVMSIAPVLGMLYPPPFDEPCRSRVFRVLKGVV